MNWSILNIIIINFYLIHLFSPNMALPLINRITINPYLLFLYYYNMISYKYDFYIEKQIGLSINNNMLTSSSGYFFCLRNMVF